MNHPTDCLCNECVRPTCASCGKPTCDHFVLAMKQIMDRCDEHMRRTAEAEAVNKSLREQMGDKGSRAVVALRLAEQRIKGLERKIRESTGLFIRSSSIEEMAQFLLAVLDEGQDHKDAAETLRQAISSDVVKMPRVVTRGIAGQR